MKENSKPTPIDQIKRNRDKKDGDQQLPPPQQFKWGKEDWEEWQSGWAKLYHLTLKMPRTEETVESKKRLRESFFWAWNFHMSIGEETYAPELTEDV